VDWRSVIYVSAGFQLTMLSADKTLGGLGYIRFLAPPDKAIRWIEGKLNLLGRVPHYVSVDQKTYGRYGVLPTSANETPHTDAIGLGWFGSNGGQRLGST
jgi:hypothetical protein